jgi:glycosyltransferase involved in cell wall biosynthesis
MVQPLVSIIIPAFNSQQWIGDTLRSAIGQSWKRKEIIVIDDGSTDQTLVVARQFQSGYVRVVAQSNRGAAAARNTGMSLSQGDYIQWLDADDLLGPDKIARQMEVLQEHRSKRTLLSSAWGRFIYRYSHAKFSRTALWNDLSPVEWLLHKMGSNLFMQTATWLVSRELTEAAGPWDTTMLSDDDGEYFCRVLQQSDGVQFMPESRVYYRKLGSGGLSYIGLSGKKVEAHWRSMKLHIACLRSLEESERVRAACATYLQTSLIYFYPERLDIFREAELLAKELGYELTVPPLSWKYSWLNEVFGYATAKRARFAMPKMLDRVRRTWDQGLFWYEGRNSHPYDNLFHGNLEI